MAKKVEKAKIIIPDGHFGGNCMDCRYADLNDTRGSEVYCRGNYGGYNRPENRNGCFYYESR